MTTRVGNGSIEEMKKEIDDIFAKRIQAFQMECLQLSLRSRKIDYRRVTLARYGKLASQIINIFGGEKTKLELQGKEIEFQGAIKELCDIQASLKDATDLSSYIIYVERELNIRLSIARDSHMPIPGKPWGSDSESVRKVEKLVKKLKNFYFPDQNHEIAEYI